jgi:hypothetical protein
MVDAMFGLGVAGAVVLSAFFGIDNGLPVAATGLCPPAVVLDGMPVVFAEELDERTLQPTDFVVTTARGRRWVPLCATTAPANEESEDRTVLLIGELGDDPTDPPQTVTVRDALKTETGHDLKGASVGVVPLAAGPELVYAEPAPAEPDTLTYPLLTPFVIKHLQSSTTCPAGTVQRVRVTWDGGVTAPGQADSGDAQRTAYTVTMSDGREVTPAALANLGDMDNNHLLCLDTTGVPVRVAAQAGLFADPNGDVNPGTSVGM